MTSYNFPMVTVPQLVASYGDVGIGMTENDFKHPKRERWEPIFVDMICVATNCSRECLYQPHLPTISALDCPELHDQGIPLYHISKAMQRLLYTCSIEDFKITDIFEPKPRRLERFCSGVINFIRFQQDRVETYNQIKQENENIAEQRKVLEKENEELCRKINNIKASRVEQEPEIKKLQDTILGLTVTIQESQEHVTHKQKQCAAGKEEIAELKANLAKLKETIAVSKEEGSRLSSQIVQSPERMKGEMDRMQARLIQLKTDKDERVQRLVEYKKKREMLHLRMNDSEQALRFLTSINEQVEKEKQVLAEIARIVDTIQAYKDQMKEMDLKEQQLKRLLQTKQDKQAKLSLQQQGKITSLKENLEYLQREKENIEQVNSQEESEMSRLKELHRKLLRKEEQTIKEHNAIIESMTNKYSQILEQVDSYHKRLGDGWESLKPELLKRIVCSSSTSQD